MRAGAGEVEVGCCAVAEKERARRVQRRLPEAGGRRQFTIHPTAFRRHSPPPRGSRYEFIFRRCCRPSRSRACYAACSSSFFRFLPPLLYIDISFAMP